MDALLTDLDRTLTGEDLRVDPRALDKLDELRQAGVRTVLVTGRILDYLLAQGLDKHVDAIVAENGGVVAGPGGAREVCDDAFAQRIRGRLGPLAERFSWGAVVGSAPREIAQEVRRRLAACGEPHGLAFNADEVMLLPEGVDKARGALRALEILGVPPRRAAAVGDGENDVVLFRSVGRSAAVANAPAAVRAAATDTLSHAYAAGFLEFADRLLAERRA